MARKSLTPEIVRLWKQNYSLTQIAQMVGCTKPNVVHAIARSQIWNSRVDRLPEEHHDWLVKAASKINAPPAAMARALLIDAIEEAMMEKQQ